MKSKHANATLETHKHINRVREILNIFIIELINRGQVHDMSKLESPEVEIFGENTDKLKGTEYGSKEYQDLLNKIKPAIEHHYSKNRHHPEFHEDGINDMDLIDLVEMLSDWRAATERHETGNIKKSLEINAGRFGMSPQLVKIFSNTIDRYFSS